LQTFNALGKTDSKIIAAQVSAELAERLEQEAASQERSVSAEIRVALRRHLDPRVHAPNQERRVA
jgi:Ribbon-helix-helix protein, copG family